MQTQTALWPSYLIPGDGIRCPTRKCRSTNSSTSSITDSPWLAARSTLGSCELSELLKGKADVEMTAVPFAGGGESVPALLGGHIEGLNCHHGEIVSHVQAGKARVLAVYEEKRNPLFPDAPTFREIGYDVTMGVYYLILGPKGLAPATVSMLHDAFKKGMDEESFVKAMKARGFDIAYEGTEDIKKRLMKDYEQNAKLVDILKLKK